MAAFTGTPVNSSLMADQKDASAVGKRADSLDVDAKLHMAYVLYTHDAAQGAGTGEIDMFRLPPGRLRIIPDLCRLVTSAFATNADLHIGTRAFTNLDGTAVAEDDNRFADNLDAGGGALDQTLPLPAAGQADLNSREGIDVYAMVDTGNIETGDTIGLMCVYQKIG